MVNDDVGRWTTGFWAGFEGFGVLFNVFELIVKGPSDCKGREN